MTYKNSQSCVINNGHFSEFFKIGRGCRQGDPMSPYLFILAIEPLAAALKLSRDCKGIKTGEQVTKIGQYADDTFLTLDGTEKSLRTALCIFDKFRYVSGLKMNPTKTQAVWLGTKAGSANMLCPDKHLNWVCRFTLLGIVFNTLELDNISEINMKLKLSTIQNVLTSYGKRNLTTIGKITVVKTLAMPKLIHIFSSLPIPPSKMLNELRRLFENFIWHGKTPKVNRDLLTQDIAEGGLKMPNIKVQIQSLKIAWIKRLINTTGDWQSLFNMEHANIPNNCIWELDKRSLSAYSKLICNPFWREVCRDWADCIDSLSDVSDILATPLWNSFFVTSYNLKMLKSTFIGHGCAYIKYLVGANRKLFTHQDFKEKFNINLNFLDYQNLIYSIPKPWRQEIRRMDDSVEATDNTCLSKLLQAFKPSNWAYGRLIKRLPYRDKYKGKWENIFETEITQGEWEEIHVRAHQCTIETKARMFQYKVIHRFIATNSYLKKVKIKDSDLCDHCGSAAEDILHLFWECDYAHTIWLQLKTWLLPVYDISELLTAKNVVFGVQTTSHTRLINHLFLITKWHMYSSKYQNCKPTFNTLYQTIKKQYTIEKSIISANDSIGIGLRRKWVPEVVALLDE